MNLEGKVVLITGAAVRLGCEIAEALAAQGAIPAVHYRTSAAEAAAVAERLGGAAFQADLRDLDAVAALPGRVVAELGRLDALVNSAAVFFRGRFGEVDAAGWELHQQVNLRAPFFLTQAFVAALPAGREGRVLNMTDARGDAMDAEFSAYSLAKAGLNSMTRGLAAALAPQVRVFGLALGQMLPATNDGPPPKNLAVLPGFAEPGTTGAAAAFLLGPGDFATGSILYLDGGRHLGGPGPAPERGAP